MTWSSVVKRALSSSDDACVIGVLLMLPIVSSRVALLTRIDINLVLKKLLFEKIVMFLLAR